MVGACLPGLPVPAGDVARGGRSPWPSYRRDCGGWSKPETDSGSGFPVEPRRAVPERAVGRRSGVGPCDPAFCARRRGATVLQPRAGSASLKHWFSRGFCNRLERLPVPCVRVQPCRAVGSEDDGSAGADVAVGRSNSEIAGSGREPETVSGFAGVLASREAPFGARACRWCGRGAFVP